MTHKPQIICAARCSFCVSGEPTRTRGETSTRQPKKKKKKNTSCTSDSEIRGNEILRWFRLQIKRKKRQKEMRKKEKVNGVSQTGPHGVPVTKQNCFLPWLIRGRTAVKHKGPADALAFHSSQNPTSSQTIPKYIHDMLELPPCSLNTHTHTQCSHTNLYSHRPCVERLMEEEKGGFPSRYCLVV